MICPSFMRTTRVASSATVGSWVLATTVTPSVEHRSRNMRTTVSPVRWSRLAVGSSARTSVGLLFATRHLRRLVVNPVPEADQLEKFGRSGAQRLSVVRLEHQRQLDVFH